MNKKRIVAVMAAATMLLNVTPVMASQTASNGGATVSGSGNVSAYDQTPKYVVTLPTSGALDFIVDPYGLLDIASGSSVSIDRLANSGVIKSASGAAAVIKNESSEAVTVSLKLSATGTNSVVLKNTGSEVATGDAVNMFLAIIPSATKAATATEYKPASYAVPVTASGSATADVAFKLDKAEYEVVNNGGSFAMQIVSGTSNYDATTFKIGGVANPKADWSDFMSSGSSDLGISVVFEYKKAEDTDVIDASKGIYGLVSGSAANITNDMGASDAISGTGMTKSNASGINYEVTGYSISKAYTITIKDGSTVSSVSVGNDASAGIAIAASNINNTSHTVTIPQGSFGNAAVGNARYIKLNTSKGALIIKVNCVA